MGKIAFLFPGQGQQYSGMGKEIAENFKVAQNIYRKASEALGMDMEELCFRGSEEDLKKTENTQPSILTTSIAIFEVVKDHGIRPDAAIGLSLGEYSAFVASGALDFEEAVKVVQKRGKFMQEEVAPGVGGMAAILGLENALVEEACKKASEAGYVSPANYNCPMQLVIAGELKAVEKAVEYCKEAGAKKAVMLPVSAPFHTKMLEGAGEKLRAELEKMKVSSLSIPVVSNVDAEFTTDSSQIIDKLVRQVSNSVLFENGIRNLINSGYDTFVEMGPDKALSKFVKKVSKDVNVYNVEDIDSLNKTLKALKTL